MAAKDTNADPGNGINYIVDVLNAFSPSHGTKERCFVGVCIQVGISQAAFMPNVFLESLFFGSIVVFVDNPESLKSRYITG